MWKTLTRGQVLLAAFLLVLYFAMLGRSFTESSRRSLQLRDETTSPDRIFVSIIVTNVNPVTQELTAQLGFRLSGEIALDEVTPAVDLKLLINNFGGQQEFDFLKGRRMNRIEAVFPLNGELNKYPLDRYESNLWVLVTTPTGKGASKTSQIHSTASEPATHSDELAIGASVLQKNSPVPISLSLTAAVPGVKFSGQATRSEESQLIRIALGLRRADNLIVVSISVMLMMSCLALSVLAMVVRAIRSHGRADDLIPLSMSISLIFGLPALRQVQPGVPPVGAFGDYVSFIWAELIVATSAVITVWTWLVREYRESGDSPKIFPDLE